MAQIFNIMYWGHVDNNPSNKFVWSEEEADGNEKYGFLFSDSISGCLTEIESYLEEYDDFEIEINAPNEFGGDIKITTQQELVAAKSKYDSFN